MGEVLHEVDFNQLKIENQQYIEKIDERNQELLRLKMMSGNTLQVLNAYKKKLNTLTMELDRVKTDISARHELLSRIDEETKIAEEVTFLCFYIIENDLPLCTIFKQKAQLPQRDCMSSEHTVSVDILSTTPTKQEAQLSPRDRAICRVSRNLASCHATVQKLLLRQVLNKSKL